MVLYTYPKNLELFHFPKILTGVLARKSSFTYDQHGIFYFVGGGNAGGYGVRVSPKNNIANLYFLGLLNCRLLDWYLKIISTQFRGGYYSYARRFIEQLPIRTINFNNTNDRISQDRMVSLVETMLTLHKRLPEVKTPQEKETIQRQIDVTDAQIDKLVYELYGLTEEEIALVEKM